MIRRYKTMVCTLCRNLTTGLAAATSLFNRGRCGECNGHLHPYWSQRKWIASDLDGVLAMIQPGSHTTGQIGPPIPEMVERCCRWMERGYEVRVFTARVGIVEPSPEESERVLRQHEAIFAFTVGAFGFPLKATASKDRLCVAIYDDRAVQIERNTGRVASPQLEPTVLQ